MHGARGVSPLQSGAAGLSRAGLRAMRRSTRSGAERVAPAGQLRARQAARGVEGGLEGRDDGAGAALEDHGSLRVSDARPSFSSFM
jgi:hypothetical protein